MPKKCSLCKCPDVSVGKDPDQLDICFSCKHTLETMHIIEDELGDKGLTDWWDHLNAYLQENDL